MSDRICVVDACEKPAKNRSMCWGHYCRLRRHGDANAPLKRTNEPAEVRWLRKVSVQSPGCWIWTDAPNGGGYGTISVDGYPQMAHRFVWSVLVGRIPEGAELDHLCKVPLCVNPDHLEPVAHVVNNRRSGSLSGQAARRDRCKAGHEYTEENTRYYKSKPTQRVCVTCARDFSRKYQQQKKETHV